MKKNLTWLFIILSSPLFAQVTFGPKIGLGLSRENYAVVRKTNILVVDDKDTKYIPLPNFSMVVDIPLSKNISIRPEFGYRKQMYNSIAQTLTNANWGSQTIIVVETVNARLNYLELPVNFAFKLPFIDNRLEIISGATVSRCIGGQSSYEYAEVDVTNEYNNGTQNNVIMPYRVREYEDLKVRPSNPQNDNGFPLIRQDIHVKPYNFNINVGLGYKIATHFLMNATFNYGLTNIAPSEFKDSSYGLYTSKSANTYSYTFSVAYMFGAKK